MIEAKDLTKGLHVVNKHGDKYQIHSWEKSPSFTLHFLTMPAKRVDPPLTIFVSPVGRDYISALGWQKDFDIDLEYYNELLAKRED